MYIHCIAKYSTSFVTNECNWYLSTCTRYLSKEKVELCLYVGVMVLSCVGFMIEYQQLLQTLKKGVNHLVTLWTLGQASPLIQLTCTKPLVPVVKFCAGKVCRVCLALNGIIPCTFLIKMVILSDFMCCLV